MMSPSPTRRTRTLPWRSPAAWIALVATLAFAALGLRGLLDPVGAGASLGTGPLAGSGARAMQAVGARNLALAVAALVLILLDARRALAVILAAASGIAALDLVVVTGAAPAPVLVKHAVYAVVLGGLAALLWRGTAAHG